MTKTQQKGPSGSVVVGRWPCEPLNNHTLLSLGGGGRLNRESHPFLIGLVFLERLGLSLSGCALRTIRVRATLIYWASANPTLGGCIIIVLKNTFKNILQI